MQNVRHPPAGVESTLAFDETRRLALCPGLGQAIWSAREMERGNSMANSYDPDPKMKFTFGLWTVGNIGRDPFGGPVREQITPAQIADLLGEVGAYGVNFHDNDLIPIDATPQQAEQIKKEFKKALKDNGL